MSKQILDLGDGLQLPPDVQTLTTAILGIRGSGKTNTGGAIVEELLERNLHACIIDPLDVWWGLKSSADGQSPGYPVVILGGAHGDLPISGGDARVIADFVVEHRLPCVLSLRHLSKTKQRLFVADFCEQLYQRKGEQQYRDPLAVVIDEASAFVPQRVSADIARSVGAIDDLVRRGRSSGIGVILIDQRPATINKDVLTQVELMIVHRITSPQDRSALNEWVRENASAEEAKEFLSSLASLPLGRAWAWSPYLNLFRQSQVRLRRTFDSSQTPRPGERRGAPKQFADVDLDALRLTLAATIAAAEDSDPRALRGRIKDLERQLADRAPQVERVEVPVLSAKEMKQLCDSLDALAAALGRVEELSIGVRENQAMLDRVRDALLGDSARLIPVVMQEQPVASPMHKSGLASAPPRSSPAAARGANGDVQIKAGARRMLEVLAANSSLRVTRAQLATLAKMRVTGGTFQTYFGTLKRAGFFTDADGTISITPNGMRFLGITRPPAPQTTEELLAQWRPALKAGAAKMLDVLVKTYPKLLSREKLAVTCDMTASGGTFQTYLGTLRRNGLAEVGDDGVRASETLFLHGGRR